MKYLSLIMALLISSLICPAFSAADSPEEKSSAINSGTVDMMNGSEWEQAGSGPETAGSNATGGNARVSVDAAGNAGETYSAGAENINATGLIAREVLFGNPERASVRISPDGRWISYLAPLDGVLNIWVAPVDNITSARPVTNDTSRGIQGYFWAYTSHHLLYIQDRDGDENWRVYSLDLENDMVKDLTPLQGVNANIQEVSYKFPGEILVGLNDRDPQLHDIYRINITTGEKQLIVENEGFAGFMTDDDYRLRFAIRMTADGGMEYLKPQGMALGQTQIDNQSDAEEKAQNNQSWDLFMNIGPDDVLTTSAIGFDKSGDVLYLTESRNRETAALASLDLSTGEEAILAEDVRADIDDIMVHPTEKNMQAAAFYYDRKRWEILDSGIASDMEYLRTVDDGDVEVTDRTLDDRLWIVAFVLDDGPVKYYLYSRADKKAEFLFSHQKELEGLPLAEMHPAVIKSRDGLNLVCYYTLPHDSDKDGDGLPDKPLPTVLIVHGGPWARDAWGYHPEHQLMANRGYAALSVNFRGSTGFGKSFINAGNMEWGRRMQDDLLDSVNWSVQMGISDPEKVAIMGGSYGGYATLAGMTSSPEFFACGVDLVGPSNLTSFLETIPPYWQPTIELWAKRVGDLRTPEGRALLEERSPLSRVDQIQRPLLIAQGGNDPRVNKNESEQIVRAMQEKSIPVTYLLYSDEGHGFVRPENRLSFYSAVEAFLAQHLGGRYEPIGDDFNGSSITVPLGADEIPGLAGSLNLTAA